ncbi:MAG: lipocalin-like domain-containing protein [Muribaculaceae bacterium]|nr:lipocalin-like domain-containing protein [Muribaculaceae bacterium]
MKKINIALLTFLILLCGCTQNNGHIGPIYGSWALEGISENGNPLVLEEETVFSFQNEIVQVIKLAEPPLPSLYRYGNFSLSDDYITLKFQAKPTENDSHMFLTPSWLHFPENGMPIQMEITKLAGNNMTWELITESGKYTYTLKRTW